MTNPATWPLSPSAVAVQGVGYAPRLVALLGLWPASPYRRAPRAGHGAGHGARPVWGTRPAMAATVRAPQAGTVRPAVQASARPGSGNTRRPSVR